MASINIMINKDTLELSNRGAILGTIWFKISDKAFPSDDWSDFVVVILTWWLKEASIFKKQKIGKGQELNFMDGPFFLYMTLESQNDVRIEFRERTFKGFQTIIIEHCQVDTIKNEIISASKKVLEFVDERGWDTVEIQQLRYVYNKNQSLL